MCLLPLHICCFSAQSCSHYNLCTWYYIFPTDTYVDLSSDETLRAAGSDGNEKYNPKDLSKPGPHYGCNKSEEAPSDWTDHDKYNPILIQIWALWLVFWKIARDIPTIQNRPVKFIPPWLPWHAPALVSAPLLVLWLHFCPTRLENSLGGRHPAAATWHEGFLPLVSDTWELVRLALGPVYWRTIKLNVIPFQFPYGGQPTDVYTEKNYKRLMDAYREFVKGVVAIVDSNMFCSIGAMERMKRDVFAGKAAFDRFIKKYRSKFLSLKPPVHPERLLNPMFHGHRLAIECGLFDEAYSEVLKLFGIATACVVAMNIFNRVENTPAYLLKKAASLGALARARAKQLMAWIAYWDGCPDEEQLETIAAILDALERGREWMRKAWEAHKKGKADEKQTKYVEDQLEHLKDLGQRRSAALNKAIGLIVLTVKTLRSSVRTRCPVCDYEENTRGTVPANESTVRKDLKEIQIFDDVDTPTGQFRTFTIGIANTAKATGLPKEALKRARWQPRAVVSSESSKKTTAEGTQ